MASKRVDEISSVEAGLIKKPIRPCLETILEGRTLFNKNSFFKIPKMMYAFASDSNKVYEYSKGGHPLA